MKKFFITIIAILLPMIASADAVEINGIYYNLNSEKNQAEVTTSPNKYTGDVKIPDEVPYNDSEYSVSSIGYNAFWNCSGLTSITIPNSVTSIGRYALWGCSGLTSVSIPNSVTSIESSAFNGCSGLTTIDVEDGNPQYDSRDNCNAIIKTSSNTLICGCKNTIIPNSVTTIGGEAFSGCSDLTSITIPNSVTSIGHSAFYRCYSLTSIVSEIENPFEISDNVFPISNTIVLTVPVGTKSAYQSTAGWNNFKNIFEVGEEIIVIGQVYESGGIYYKIGENNTVSVISGEIKYSGDVVIPSQVVFGKTSYSVTSIGNRAFQGCTDLTSITIPNSVTSIGSDAFGGCSGLTSVTIPNSVKSIGEWAFSGCSGLTSITIPNGLTSIEWGAFYWCTGLTSVTIPNSVTSIVNWAFGVCSGLTSITIPNSVTSIGDNAFEGCSGLTSITIPNSVTSIGHSAFYRCYSLTSIISEIENPFEISDNVFPNSNSIVLTIPVGTKSAYQSTAGWNNFKNIFEVGEEIIVIGQVYESGGIYYKIGENNTVSVTSGEGKYSGDVVIPSQVIFGKTTYSVTAINNQAFSGCSGLTSITIPKSVTSIGNRAFQGCSGLTSVTIPSIGFMALSGCTGLTSVATPNSVISIGQAAFWLCSGLTSITIPNSVTSISDYAFWGCSGLTSVTISNSVTSIGDEAFTGCSGLTSITIPNSVTSIGEWAFDCSALTSIVSEIDDPFEISDNVFPNSNSIVLTVPVGTKSAYLSTAGWNQFKNIFEVGEEIIVIGQVYESGGIYYKIGENNTVSVISGEIKYSGDVVIPSQVVFGKTSYSVTSIGNRAFQGCTDLTSITIPNSVTSIGECAFSGCSGLTSITIPNSLTSIEWGAFYWCSGLTSVTIPNSVTSIVNLAFSGCSGLTSITIPNSVTSIGEWAFDCSALTSIVSEIDDPFEISDNVFPNSNSIVLTVPVGTKSAYQSTAGWNQFKNIFEVGEEIIVIGQVYESGGIYYKIGENNTVSVISGEIKYSGDVVIPSQVVFGKTTYSVTAINNQAFKDCSGVTSVTIPNSIISIGNASFEGCCSLNTLNIPNSVIMIDRESFAACSSLTSVTIPSSVTQIGESAFANCSGLTFVISEIKTPFKMDNSVFGRIPSDVQLIVPKGSKADYQSIEGWNIITNIIERADIEGDTNGDDKVNEADVEAVNSYILKKNTTADFNRGAADMDGNGKIDVADLVLMLNIFQIK